MATHIPPHGLKGLQQGLQTIGLSTSNPFNRAKKYTFAGSGTGTKLGTEPKAGQTGGGLSLRDSLAANLTLAALSPRDAASAAYGSARTRQHQIQHLRQLRHLGLDLIQNHVPRDVLNRSGQAFESSCWRSSALLRGQATMSRD